MKIAMSNNLMAGILCMLAFAFTLSLIPVTQLQAETLEYAIRVDGLTCPFCAYGIEKKLNKIEGVTFKNMDLDKGVVTVEAIDVTLSDAQLKQLFQDAGFTYKSKQEKVK
ncbi:hypothetical protein MNBD_GAMMA25-214 [hydrothermal vent metagenome]|uniref:HMA domain-containing protein n=1 Tax=hydrothermal vent metagenome TaxID=652676 RepID=A0A3B1BDC3_9ZZZZ